MLGDDGTSDTSSRVWIRNGGLGNGSDNTSCVVVNSSDGGKMVSSNNVTSIDV